MHTITVTVADDGTVTLVAEGSVAEVVAADTDASNGIIHGISNVLLPFQPSDD